MTIADHVLTAIENTLLTTPGVYRYRKIFPRILATTGTRCWSPEDIFLKYPVRRLIVAKATNQFGLNITPVQNQNSYLFGLFAFRFPVVMFGYEYLLMLNMNYNDLLRSAKRLLSIFEQTSFANFFLQGQ